MPVDSDYLSAVRAQLWAKPVFTFVPDLDLPPAPRLTGRLGGGPRVLFVGLPSDYSLAFLLALLELEVEPVGIVTSPGAHPAILGDNALSRIADHLSIPLLRLWRVNDDHSIMDLQALKPDLAVMASYDQIVRRRGLNVPTHGWINLHPSLLPHFRGPEPIYWTIAEGSRRAGITAHRAVPTVDAGPILAQVGVNVDPEETSGTLTRRLCAVGGAILPPAVDALLRDQPGTPMDLEAGSYFPPVGHRDLRRAPTVEAAARWVRAGNPSIPPWIDHHGAVAYVLKARVGTSGVSFPDGRLELLELAATCHCHHDTVNCPHREIGTSSD